MLIWKISFSQNFFISFLSKQFENDLIFKYSKRNIHLNQRQQTNTFPFVLTIIQFYSTHPFEKERETERKKKQFKIDNLLQKEIE